MHTAVWGVGYVGTTRTVDQHVAQLRKKVEPDPEAPRAILTVHGVGYRCVAGASPWGAGDAAPAPGKGR